MLCSRKFPVAKKFLDKRGGGVSRFSIENFLSHSPEKIRRGPFLLSLISGIEIFYASEDYVTISRRNFFVSQYRNISKRNPSMLCFRKSLVAKKFMDKMEGEVSRFPSKMFCLTVPKDAVEE